MRDALTQMAMNLNGNRRRRKNWQKVVSILACIVVFCTTYALILPAITMEKEAICGMEEHEHSESCFEKQITYSLSCMLEMTDEVVVHKHNEICYGADGTLICTLPEVMEHSHEESCYDNAGNLLCTLPEIAIHSHEESCYEVSKSLICTLAEVTEHKHEVSCYDAEGNLICSLVEVAEHKHEAGCYDAEGNLICSLPEITAHTHGDACYEEQKRLVCEREFISEHVHIEECLTEEVSESVLVCQIPVHIHGDTCFAEPETEEQNGFLCGSGEHTHSEACYNEEGVLNCTIPEHAHDATCIEELVDLTADVETKEQWENTMSQLTLTGNWQENLLAVAQTQMGYKESVKNVILENGVLKGYTRFGAWYGIPYGDWDAMFVSFCLNYAGVPESVISWENNGQRWLDNLQNQGQLEKLEAHTLNAGDLLFYDRHNGTAVGVGIVKAIEMQTNAETGVEEVKQITVLTGDVEDKVAEKNILAESVKAVCNVDKIQQIYEGTYVEETEQKEENQSNEDLQNTQDIQNTEDTQNNQDTANGMVTQTDETENYIVTVTYPSELVLPEGAELRVFEYAKDSEIFKQRCKEAGYELEWLLNIGFFVGDTELALDGRFAVVVTAKQGDEISGRITHFADDGMESISGSKKIEDGQNSVMFSANGFSDFGGGVVTLAETTHSEGQMTSVRLDLTGYTPYNEASQITFNGATTYSVPVGSLVTLTIGSDYVTHREIQVNVSGGNVISTTYACEKNWCDHSNCRSKGTHTVVIEITEPNAVVTGTVRGGWWGTNSFSYEYHPHAVHTGEINIDGLRFYNLSENGNQGVSALAGCVFEIKGDNGYTATITSGSDPEIFLPLNANGEIPDGTYTITEVSVPAGYMRDTNYERTFVVEDGKFVGENNIGIFLNHKLEQLEADKTAEVEDYNNRMYQILLSAKSNMQMYEIGPIDVFFVIDQSNSMLFPSGLEETGKSVTLRLDGTNNVNNMERLNLDKSQMYYLISDPHGTSTVWALWHDGTSWMYQDASYYAKAKHANEEGYQDDNETVIFPENRSYADQANAEGDGVRSNGGGLGYSLSGSGLGKYIDTFNNDTQTFLIYTATGEYNRLHYLEESIVNMIYQLAYANSENRVAVTEFTKEVKEEDCEGPLKLTPDNTKILVDEVTNIHTSGGTRQDIALKHVAENHLNNPNDPDRKPPEYTYTILITDGAPVLSAGSSITNLGSANDAASTTANSVYAQIKGYANEVKKHSSLMTVGLGMGDVEAGSAVLKEIASNQNLYCPINDASELIETMQELLFNDMSAKGEIEIFGDLVDEITDSFYPIAWVNEGTRVENHMSIPTADSRKDWILLNEGDWITLDGKYTTAGAWDAAGQLFRKEDGTFYIKWLEQKVSGSNGWDGTFYVKAKEDFIGGNAIDTNKSASITVHEATKDFEIPTVNVRLLDMNEMNSEVTVYLGDIINEDGNSPLDSLKYFYENTKFTKLLSGTGDVLNKVTSADGLEAALFYLRYAMGRDLTDEGSESEWVRLVNGAEIHIPYTYDDASSHGAVGYFTFRLEKNGIEGATPSYNEHEATAACQPNGSPLTENCNNPAETYILHVTYTAYELGENGRPATNVHNGTGHPGTEVGTGTTLENGLGVVKKENVHEVHVISGTIEILKKFAEGITSTEDYTFSFTLHRTEDGTDTTNDVTKTITIPAGATTGSASIIFDNLRRGTYTVTEGVDDSYTVQEIRVLGGTNCYSTPVIGATAVDKVTFVMGNNVSNANVIGKEADARYTSYIDPVNGVYGKAEFVNEEIVYTGEIPVIKLWDDGEQHGGDEVYLVLYESDTLVLDSEGRAKVLKLDSSNWSGCFTVVLKDKDDNVSNYDYSVREVSQVSTASHIGWQKAILENDGSEIFYEKALISGELITVNDRNYVVHYEITENGTLIVKNNRGVELPETGGMGTQPYTFGGLVLILAALMYGCLCRRNRKNEEC